MDNESDDFPDQDAPISDAEMEANFEAEFWDEIHLLAHRVNRTQCRLFPPCDEWAHPFTLPLRRILWHERKAYLEDALTVVETAEANEWKIGKWNRGSDSESDDYFFE